MIQTRSTGLIVSSTEAEAGEEEEAWTTMAYAIIFLPETVSAVSSSPTNICPISSAIFVG